MRFTFTISNNGASGGSAIVNFVESCAVSNVNGASNTCIFSYPQNTNVNIKAQCTNEIIESWTGACAVIGMGVGAGTGTCSLTMDNDKVAGVVCGVN